MLTQLQQLVSVLLVAVCCAGCVEEVRPGYHYEYGEMGGGEWVADHVADAKKMVPTPAMRVYFAPGPDCEKAACELIGKAEKEIKIRAYNFSSAKIRDAIQAARSRGVEVTAIVDHKALAERKCIAPDLIRAGCAIYDDNNHRIAHSKIIVTDAKCVCFGSYNFSESAKKNAEVMVVRENDREFAKEFEDNFKEHLAEKRTTKITN